MAFERWREQWNRFFGRGTYPHQLAFALLFPGRGLVLSPRALADRLELRPDDRVLELGPGPGYFSPEVARRLPRGRLELFDLQVEMLRKADRRLRRAGLANFGLTRGSGERLPYQEAVFDVVFLVAVLGEVPDPPACLASVARVVRAGGRVLVAELPGDPDAIPRDELRRLGEAAGLEPGEVRPVTLGRKGFTASFRKPQ